MTAAEGESATMPAANSPTLAATGSPTMAAACPAFSDGCPYASSDKVVEWINAKRSDAIGTCPAFKEGCPFSDVRDLDSLCKELQKLPPSHAGAEEGAEGAGSEAAPKPAHDALVGMLSAVHQASQKVKEAVGSECPVFQQACPFKNCVTSSGTPLMQELDTRTWGLMIRVADADAHPADAEEAGAVPVVDDLGLAKKLKQGTQEAHKAAETVHFVREFIKGRVPREIYAQFVVNLYHVYAALEEALDACADNHLVEPLYFPDELQRAGTLRRDAEYFNGPDWEEKTSPSEVTKEYVARLHQVARESPELIVPHAYTRYLGDLSGGQVLRRAAVRGLKLPDDGSGVCFYTFKRVRDAKAFKNMYRARLDSLPADQATADAMVDEANRAFNFNTRIFQELDALGGFVLEEAPPLTATPGQAAEAHAGGDAAAAATGTKGVATGAAAGCPFAALAASGVPMPADHPPLEHPAAPAAAAKPRVAKAAPRREAKAVAAAAPPSGKPSSSSRGWPGTPLLVALAFALLALLLGLAGRLSTSG